MKGLIAAILLLSSTFVWAADVPDISAQELLSTQTQEWLILDVRSAEEYAEGHVPGAINISHDSISAYMSSIEQYRDKPVVVYCRSGYRAGKAASVLLDANFTDVRHLEGDMKGWLEAGLETEQ